MRALAQNILKKREGCMQKGASVCGLNGFHSRNEMTNVSEGDLHPHPHPTFLWGKRLLDLDRYLPNK